MSNDNKSENKSKINMRDVIREKFGFEITDDLLIKSKGKDKSWTEKGKSKSDEQKFRNAVLAENSNGREIKHYYKKTKPNEEAQIFGNYLIKTMSDEDYDNIRSNSDKLHFMNLLGLASKKKNPSKEKIEKNSDTEPKFYSTPIGIRLKTDIDIERVPFLKDEKDENGRYKVTKNKDTGINQEEDFEYKTVKAGQIFDLTLYEFMYLIIRDEYGGYLKVYGEDFYAHLSVKLPAFWRGDAKLPTPTIVFEKGNKTARGSILDIDEKSADGWIIKPEFKRFEPLVNSSQSKRKRKVSNSSKVSSKSGNNNNVDLNYPNPSLYSLALQEELGLIGSVGQQKDSSEDDLLNRGKEIILSMDVRRRKLLGSKSSTLHIVNILGFEPNNSFVAISKPIGVTLVSDEEIIVPVIDIKRDKKTGITPAIDINYHTVSAGKSFYVSNYEFMYLIIRDEYVGFCEFDGNNQGAFLLPNFKLYFDGKNKLPVPNIKFSDGKAPSMVDIHQTNENGFKEIKLEYSEKFGALLE